MWRRRKPDPYPQIGPILQRLGSRDADTRAAAEAELEGLGGEGVERILYYTEAADRRFARARRVSAFAWLTALVGVFATPVSSPRDRATFTVMVLVLSGLLLAYPMLQASLLRWLFLPPSLSRALLALASCADERAVGALVRMLDWETPTLVLGTRPDWQVRAAAVSTLTSLLPTLTPQDAGQISATGQDTLIRTIKSRAFRGPGDPRGGMEFLVAIVRGLGAAGDSNARHLLEELAYKDPPFFAAHVILRRAAQDVLPAMRERLQAQERAGTLLRPASAPDAPSETLLRPAHGLSEADPALLLRPAAPDGDPEPATTDTAKLAHTE